YLSPATRRQRENIFTHVLETLASNHSPGSQRPSLWPVVIAVRPHHSRRGTSSTPCAACSVGRSRRGWSRLIQLLESIIRRGRRPKGLRLGQRKKSPPLAYRYSATCMARCPGLYRLTSRRCGAFRSPACAQRGRDHEDGKDR